jgi:hypothetical protein
MTQFVLCKAGKSKGGASLLCRTSDQRLCVWNDEESAQEYADSRNFEKWLVRPATSEDYGIVGHMKANKHNRTRPCYLVMEKRPLATKKTSSSGSLVEMYENYESRKFAISSRADNEKEFLIEIAQAMSATQTPDWHTRLKELLPLIVEMCCKYRGYKTDIVVERRELVAGDLEMPSKATT